VVLEDRDIIQIDATVIAGVLILLTLSSVQYSENTRASTIFLKSGFIFITIVPFAFSAFNEIDTILRKGNTEKRRRWSLFLMNIGFMYMILAIAYIVVIPPLLETLWK
jgi:hypothetical protein